MNMPRSLVLALLLCPTVLWGTTSTYTFDYPGRITTGTLAGQDNWNVLTTTPQDSSDVVQSGTAFYNSPTDTSNVMANPVSAGPSGVHRMYRTNDGNFSFGSLAGATGLTLSFDTQVLNMAADCTEFINFSLADASDGHSAPTLAYKQQSGGTPQWAIAGSPGGGGASGFSREHCQPGTGFE